MPKPAKDMSTTCDMLDGAELDRVSERVSKEAAMADDKSCPAAMAWPSARDLRPEAMLRVGFGYLEQRRTKGCAGRLGPGPDPDLIKSPQDGPRNPKLSQLTAGVAREDRGQE